MKAGTYMLIVGGDVGGGYWYYYTYLFLFYF